MKANEISRNQPNWILYQNEEKKEEILNLKIFFKIKECEEKK